MNRLRRLLPFIVAAVTAAAFLPTIDGEFLNWDDDRNFLRNPGFRGLGLEQLRWMLTAFHLGHYIPVSWLTLAADHALWGMDPRGYHLTNVLLHAANAVLLYFLSLRLFRFAAVGASRGAGLSDGVEGAWDRLWAAAGALFYSLHPLRVESVAWITERRDVLSLFFVLLTLLTYTREPRTPRRRALCLLLAAAAMFSKPTAVMIPVLLLVLDAYPLRRFGGKLFSRENARPLLEKAPFFALSLAAGLLAVAGHAAAGQFVGLERHSLTARLAQAAYVTASPLARTLWPFGLSPVYRHPHTTDFGQPIFWLCGAAVLALAAALIWKRRAWPAAAAAGAAYVATLAPFWALAEGNSINHDRYSQLPSLGLAMLAAGVLAKRGAAARSLAVAAAVLAALFALTQKQNAFWRDSVSLWTRAARAQPSSFVAHYNLGTALAADGRHSEAAARYAETLRIYPKHAAAQNNWAVSLAALGRPAEAEARYRAALELKPDSARPRNGLGLLALAAGDVERAAAWFEAALRHEDDFAEAWGNLGYARLLQGRTDEALGSCERAAALDPSLKEPHNNLGLLAAERKEFAEAAEHYLRALRLDPAFSEAHANLANALAAQGDREGALTHYAEALRIRPLPETHFNLGLVLERSGEGAAARHHFREALKLDPNFAPAKQRLGGGRPKKS